MSFLPPMDRLTDEMVQNATPRDKPYKMADSGGMYLYVMPTGSKYWRMDYRFERKQYTLAFGVYPDVSLSVARVRKDEAKAMLASGINPAVPKREARIEAAQQKALVKFETKPPSFRLSIADNALTIQAQSNKLTLSPEQTDAVRAFLVATPKEVKP